MIEQREREIVRQIEPDLAPAGCVALDLDGGLEQLAHVAPFAAGADDAALESVHVEEVVDYAVEPLRAGVDFARELLLHRGIGR